MPRESRAQQRRDRKRQVLRDEAILNDILSDQDDPYGELVEWIREELIAGREQSDLVAALVQSGWTKGTAHEIVAEVAASPGVSARGETATKDFVVAAIAAAIGGGVTVATYSEADAGGSYWIFWGPAAYGGFRFIQGLIKLFSKSERTGTEVVAAASATGVVAVVVFAFAFSLGAFESDSTAVIDQSLTGLSAGDCIEDPGAVSSVVSLERVPCGTPGSLRVTNTFNVSGYEEYPGESIIDSIATDRCATSATFYFSPSDESWQVGDRLVVCTSD